MKTKLHFIAALAFVAIAAEAFGGWDVPPSVRTIALNDVLKASSEMTLEKYPDADTILIDSVTYEKYEPDGTSVVWDDTYTKILTDRGRRNEETASLHFNVFYGTNEVIAAEIIKPSGDIVKIDLTRNSQIMVDPGSMSANIYDPNDKIITVSYPGLEIGDIVRLAFKETRSKTRIPNAWSDYRVFESTMPIDRYSYYVEAPKELPLKTLALRDEVSGTITNYTEKCESGTMHIWNVTNVPQIFPEPNMPALYTVAQRVLVSTLGSWEEVSKWYWNLSLPHLTPSPEMEAMVKEILSNSGDSDESRLWNIFTWVSQNIRYMGITTETESPGYEPHDAKVTFEKRYGVCRDKAALLVAMLRAAGFDAYPVLIHVGEKRDKAVPMTFFNHAIVCVREKDGTYRLMDPTNESTADFLPAYLADKSYLVARPEGETLLVSDIIPAHQNMAFITNTGRVDKSGNLTLSAKIEFEGLNDSTYRSFFRSIPNERRKTFLEGIVKARLPGASLKAYEISPTELSDTGAPLVVTLEIEAKDYLASGGGITLVNLPRFATAFGYVNFIIGTTGLDKREFPLETEEACGVAETTTLEISENRGAPLSLPDFASFSTNGITFSQNISVSEKNKGRGIYTIIKRRERFEINKTTFEPNEYLGLKESLHEVERFRNQRVIFPGQESELDKNADIRILNRETIYDIADNNSWTTTVSVTREILTYAGRKSASELIINYNPIWEEVELLHASVTNLDGTVHIVRDEEINIMDAAWVASAPRYPAAKKMVVSLPGVEIGSIVSTSYRVVKKNALFFFVEHCFQSVNPMVKDRLVINSTDNMTYAISAANTDPRIQSSVVTNGMVESVQFEITNPETLPREEYLPKPGFYADMITASSGDWIQYFTAINEDFRKNASTNDSPKAVALAKKLCEGIDNPLKKVEALRNYVMRNIRLAGPAFTALPIGGTKADITLQDGYANRYDRAILLCAMLQGAEIGPQFKIEPVLTEPTPVVVAMGITEDMAIRTLPQPGLFTIPLVSVSDYYGMFNIFLNDTDEYTPIFANDSNYSRVIRIAAPGKSMDEIEIIRPEEGFENFTSVRSAIELNAAGDAIITVTNFCSGIDSGSMRRAFSEMTPEELRRFHLDLIGSYSRLAKPIGEIGIETNKHPHYFTYQCQAPSYASKAENILSVDIGKAEPVIRLRADTRTKPIQIIGTDSDERVITIIMPEETEEVLSMPKSIIVNEKEMHIPSRIFIPELCLNNNNRFELKITDITTSTYSPILLPEYHATLLELNKKLTKPEQHIIVIKLSD